MSKRKAEDSDDDPTPDLVDVNFDYYNVHRNDYHAIQRLFIQLFGPDVQTGPLADLVTTVAAESGVGSTIKTDEDEEADPYALLTAISCRDHPGLKGVLDHVLSNISGVFHDTLESLLASQHVGLVLSERLVNMPVQVMGPMYTMLADEIGAAGDGYQFTHYLFVSRAYRDEEATQHHAKRPKTATDGVYPFHPEDDEILQFATHTALYTLDEQVLGRAVLVPGNALSRLVSTISDTYRV